MKDTIFYVGGGKGGVGKSMVALTLIQYLIDKFSDSKTVHLVETDESNPDVGRVYKGKIPMTPVILDENEDGWLHMAGVMEKSSDTLFVVNSAARSNMGIRRNGANLVSVLENGKLPYNLVVFWPMNRNQQIHDNARQNCV
jgi:CO dehydrogenase nickel-insertion accessory protein CooC1